MSPGARLPLTIFGPTAAGKTALAIALARALDGVIINADALQVYADLPMLTARPSADEQAQAPHRLYGFLPAEEKMDVARWLSLARAAAAEAQGAGKLPIFCGGTGFYLKALTQGLSPIPQVALGPAQERLDQIGIAAFEGEVFAADPALRQVFEAGDRQRLLRAWSVWQATGRVLSTWQAAPKTGGIGAVHAFALLPDRAALYGRIDQRFAQMMRDGVVGQVAASPLRAEPSNAQSPHAESPHAEILGTLSRSLGRGALPLAQAIGAREILAHLRGEISEAVVIAAASQQTRNYAKRQITWVRNQTSKAIKLPYKAINKQQIDELSQMIVSYLSEKP